MKMKSLLLSALFVAFAQVPAQATDDKKLVQNLYELSQDLSSDKIEPVRGGSKTKPLGLYLGKSNSVQFKSGYKDVDAKTQCEWALALHTFVDKNGGGFDNYRKYQKEGNTSTIEQDNARNLTGAKDAHDAFERAHVSYDKQAAFAEQWWKQNSQAFNKTVLPPKEWWTNDAVLDGNNLWTRYEYCTGKSGGADYVMWRDADLNELLKKK